MPNPDIYRNLGISRRDVIKRGAIAGGALVWATPVVQTLGSGVAGAQTPRCEATADAIDITAELDTADRRNVTFHLTEEHACDPCPEEEFLVTWTCRDEFNFTCDTPPPAPSDGATTYGGTIRPTDNPGGESRVTVQADITVICEDGEESSCVAVAFEFERTGPQRDNNWSEESSDTVDCV